MKKSYLLFTFLLCGLHLFAQFKVVFIIQDKTSMKHDDIYIMGPFNNWSRNDAKYKLAVLDNDHKSISLNLSKGKFEYIFFRNKGATSYENKEIGNDQPRSAQINGDTTINTIINQWYDDIDRFKKLLEEEHRDTMRLWLLSTIGQVYCIDQTKLNTDSALWYAQQMQAVLQNIKSSGELSQQAKHYADLKQDIRYRTAEILTSKGMFSQALQLRLQNLEDLEQSGNTDYAYWAMADISNQYLYMKDYEQALNYCYKMKAIVQSGYVFQSQVWKEFFKNKRAESFYLNGFTLAFNGLNKLDSALYYGKQYYELAQNRKDTFALAMVTVNLGNIYSKSGNDDLAFNFYRLGATYAISFELFNMVGEGQLGIARIFKKKGELDSALYYARKSWLTYQTNKDDIETRISGASFDFVEVASLLSQLYKLKNQFDSAYKYLELTVVINDSLYAQEKVRQGQNITFKETLRKQQQEQERIDTRRAYETKLKVYSLVAGVGILLLVAFMLVRNNRQKQKANALLQRQKEKIETTLVELKSTQAQLIQSEKMASLGELTAGIAHEIQNPLNFVNNFSEVNTELITELVEEVDKGNTQEVRAIANDIKDNEEKINHHGKRADAIVKGMLQHSRKSDGVKEPTDINALCDEYLRLSYHGLRAKDKDFNATIKTDFDETIGKINIIPQDIGRVLLNLYNNAFYAINKKKITANGNYKPLVLIQTKKINDKIEIAVKDNGDGISESIKDKIFQPFFTTKPTGDGTGLGLSLSYDIIKAHAGEMKVRTKEGDGSEFIIQLPIV
jgi:signal transduction histidine kinase